MRLEQLSIFVEVSRCQSFSLAASRLFMSQQNISVAISKLEAELGFLLFERSHHGVTLTPRGEEALVLVEDILQQAGRLKALGHSAKKQLAGELRVEAVPYIALPEMIVDFYLQNPAIAIKTSDNSPTEIIANLLNGSCDVGFIYLRNEETLVTPGLELEKLYKDELYFCVSKKLKYPRRDHTISELLGKKLPLIMFDKLHDWTMEAFDMINEQHPLVYRADIQVYKKMIQGGLAAGFATKTGLDQEIVFKKGEVDTLRIQGLYLTVCMLYDKSSMTALKTEFLNMIRVKLPGDSSRSKR